MKTKQAFPPGHFYSPIPDLEDVERYAERIFDVPAVIPGVNLNPDGQRDLFEKFLEYYNDMPFTADKQDQLRYYYENNNFSYFDAISLHCMIRYARPKKIIEIGSGFSSCMTLDTNEVFFENRIDCTFIEPYPDLLYSLLKPEDRNRVAIFSQKLQDVPTETFSALSSGDILFIDSTHVSRVDSDVNHELFRVLPSLPPGVFIHFHDIFYPFEYPKQWICDGRAWNENYLLRAFLQFNNVFKIRFFNDWFRRHHFDLIKENMPLAAKNTGGSIWLQKVS